MTERKYVDMVVLQYRSGSVKPLFLIWEDGVKYTIDRILDIQKTIGGQADEKGILYRCLISGHKKNIYMENDRWYVEVES